ncbi:common central domain of tyrosinase-domain-containing protein [Chaetomium sp. MPI-SDFR-AT-0129]|nr:common central domain of tyrosinase-domain-containing protein [Chaetomium sp. MPI-SDFR-AT-0129]
MAAGDEDDFYVITGIQEGRSGPDGKIVPLRLEVDSWYPPDPERFSRAWRQVYSIQNSLFLWALKIFQEKSPEEKLSFFQIAGIHGSPYEPWDELDRTAATGNQGYCTHNSLLFLPWHRPYLALYEQVLHNIMIEEVIETIPERFEAVRKEWKSAADTWRLPYWDWAVKKSRPDPASPGTQRAVYDLPIIAKTPRIKVFNLEDPKGHKMEIGNPMYQFRIPGGVNMGSLSTFQFSKSLATSRWAPFNPKQRLDVRSWARGTVDNDSVAAALETYQWFTDAVENLPLAEMVYRLYTPNHVQTYGQFATTRKPAEEDDGKPSTYLNLEFIHNNIHKWNNAIGATRTRSWFATEYNEPGNWDLTPGTISRANTPLAPFHKDAQGTFWDTLGIEKWTTLGYTYPELQPWLDRYRTDDGFDDDNYKHHVREQLRALYRPEGSPTVAPWDDPDFNGDYIVNVTYDR